MTQEVRVMLQLTLDVDTNVSENVLKLNLKRAIELSLQKYPLIRPMMVDIIEIREEAEIYGNE